MPTSQEGDPSASEQELTKDNPIKSNTIEELKSKLGNKEIVESDDLKTTNMIPETQKGSPAQPHITEEGLIIPRKPPNPMLEDKERQNLHRELMFNQKIGKNVLNQKTELQRALEKHKENIAKKEQEHHQTARPYELQKAIAEREKRRQDATVVDNEDDRGLSREFLEARAKLRTRTESK